MSTTHSHLETLNIAQATRQLLAAVAANATVMFEGNPGVGKSVVTSQIYDVLNANLP